MILLGTQLMEYRPRHHAIIWFPLRTTHVSQVLHYEPAIVDPGGGGEGGGEGHLRKYFWILIFVSLGWQFEVSWERFLSEYWSIS